MTLLRHPVVITSLEEDFRKIGLITEERRDEEAPTETDEEDHGEYDLDDEDDEDMDEACASSKKKSKKPPMGEDESSDEDDEDAAMAEAIAFHQGAKEMWSTLGEAGVETITLDEEDMETLEGMAVNTTTLPGGVIDEEIDAEDDEPIDEEEESDEDEVDESTDDDGGDEDEEVVSPFQRVAEAMGAIEAVLAEDAAPPATIEEATPAFANLALISEKLYGFYTEQAQADDDKDFAEIAESFKTIAQYSAAIVDTLQTEDPDTIDMNALVETFGDYLGTVLQGLETYALLREAAEGAGEGEDEDEDEGEFDEDDEGNG